MLFGRDATCDEGAATPSCRKYCLPGVPALGLRTQVTHTDYTQDSELKVLRHHLSEHVPIAEPRMRTACLYPVDKDKVMKWPEGLERVNRSSERSVSLFRSLPLLQGKEAGREEL